MFIKKIAYIAIIFIMLISYTTPTLADDEEENELEQNEIRELVIESATKPSEEPKLNARAAIIYDRETKEIIIE